MISPTNRDRVPFTDRSLAKHTAMRRTLFVLPGRTCTERMAVERARRRRLWTQDDSGDVVPHLLAAPLAKMFAAEG